MNKKWSLPRLTNVPDEGAAESDDGVPHEITVTLEMRQQQGHVRQDNSRLALAQGLKEGADILGSCDKTGLD